MMTFPANNLAEQLEVDRATMLKALRNTPPDLVKRGNRPTWKIATAARALEAHRAKQMGVRDPAHDPEGDRLIAAFNARLAALDDLPELEDRRATARAFVPDAMGEIERHLRGRARYNNNPDMANVVVDSMLHLLSKGLLTPCQWNSDDAWLCVLGPDPEDVEAA